MNYEPVVAGNQSKGIAGIKECENAGKAREEIVSSKDYTLLPFLTQDLLFSSSSKDSLDVGFKPLEEEEKKDAKDPENEDSKVPNTEEPRVNQEQDANVNSTNNINTISPTVNAADIKNNVVDENIVYGCDDDPKMPNLEEIVYSDDDEGMDVKSAFLYGKIEEEVYVCQPSGFEDPDFHDIVYKVENALYGLHQAPRAWYETLLTYLLDNGFQRGKMDKTLFIKRDKMIFLKQKEDGIFISQDKYVTEILKKFSFSDVKTASTPMETHKPLLKDADGKDVDEHLYRSMIGSLMYLTSSRPDIMFADSPFDLVAYTDSDYAGASLIDKSTNRRLSIPRVQDWFHGSVEADCGTKIHIDNESTICIVKNPVFHSKTKHIEIRHHFIRDSNEKKLIQMIKIHTDQNVADLLTKAFDVGRFQYLITSIRMLNL
ncbi:putative ribonuclease H-like domain-containing protein [Tanacetum coccineum]